MIRKFVVTPGEFGPEYVEVDDGSFVVFADEDDFPSELGLVKQTLPTNRCQQEWDDFFESAADNTRVSIADVKELWTEPMQGTSS